MDGSRAWVRGRGRGSVRIEFQPLQERQKPPNCRVTTQGTSKRGRCLHMLPLPDTHTHTPARNMQSLERHMVCISPTCRGVVDGGLQCPGLVPTGCVKHDRNRVGLAAPCRGVQHGSRPQANPQDAQGDGDRAQQGPSRLMPGTASGQGAGARGGWRGCRGWWLARLVHFFFLETPKRKDPKEPNPRPCPADVVHKHGTFSLGVLVTNITLFFLYI